MGPNRAQTRARQAGNHRLRAIREIGSDPVAFPDARRPESLGRSGHCFDHVCSRDLLPLKTALVFATKKDVLARPDFFKSVDQAFAVVERRSIKHFHSVMATSD